VPKEKLAPGVNAATTFKSVSINTAIYLPWLASQCLKGEVVIKRAILKHISEAKSLHHSGRKADLVVNCTGLLASQLGGVMDKNVIPARGQLVHVRNDPGIMITVSGTDDGDDEATYIIPRAAGKSAFSDGTLSSLNANSGLRRRNYPWWLL
jgi:D-amino-acid oxidase